MKIKARYIAAALAGIAASTCFTLQKAFTEVAGAHQECRALLPQKLANMPPIEGRTVWMPWPWKTQYEVKATPEQAEMLAGMPCVHVFEDEPAVYRRAPAAE